MVDEHCPFGTNGLVLSPRRQLDFPVAGDSDESFDDRPIHPPPDLYRIGHNSGGRLQRLERREQPRFTQSPREGGGSVFEARWQKLVDLSGEVVIQYIEFAP